MRLAQVTYGHLLESITTFQITLQQFNNFFLFFKQDYLSYVVIHFIEHNEVEVAPSRWLEWNEEVRL